MTTRAEAFAAQAAADLQAYELLATSGLPRSHALHQLQMWLEKLCKAYLWLPEATVDGLRLRHNVVAKVLPQLIAQHWRRIGFAQQPNMKEVRRICRDIDLLHPQVDDHGRRPDNVEYPWIGPNGDAEVPARWSFSLIRSLHSGSGRLLLKAAVAITRNPTIYQG